jgi:hypothetical protein
VVKRRDLDARVWILGRDFGALFLSYVPVKGLRDAFLRRLSFVRSIETMPGIIGLRSAVN